MGNRLADAGLCVVAALQHRQGDLMTALTTHTRRLGQISPLWWLLVAADRPRFGVPVTHGLDIVRAENPKPMTSTPIDTNINSIVLYCISNGRR